MCFIYKLMPQLIWAGWQAPGLGSEPARKRGRAIRCTVRDEQWKRDPSDLIPRIIAPSHSPSTSFLASSCPPPKAFCSPCFFKMEH